MNELEQLQRQFKHIVLEKEPYHKEFWPKWKGGEPPDFTLRVYYDGKDSGHSSGASWPPTDEQIKKLKRYDYELRAKHYLESLFPDLVLMVHIYTDMWFGAPDISVWIKRRIQNKWVDGKWEWQDRGEESLGSYSLEKGIRKTLMGLQQIAWQAKAPGMFLCTSCKKIQPIEDREAIVFAGHYCKSCYQNDSQVKSLVNDSRRSGFYE
jgi:hypothetical protein